MNVLRRALYLQAAVWSVAGAALAVAPRFVLVTLFGQPGLSEPAWLRLLGVNAFGLSLLVVLVAQRAEQLWWWSWALALVSVGTAGVSLLNAAFSLSAGQSPVLWWTLGGLATALSLGLLYGLYLTAREYEPR